MRTMQGKREQNRARKRAEIVRIATCSFFQHGYGATSMSAIAEELGGSKATLWAHFSSKEELLAAVIDQLVDSFAQELDEVLAGQTFSLPTLRRLLSRYLERLMSENAVHLFNLTMSEGSRFPEILEVFYSRGPKTARTRILDFYATRFTEDVAAKLTRLTLAAASGYRLDYMLRPQPPTTEERNAFVDSFVELIEAWIEKHAGQ